ncbi:MAG TPA: cytochrome c biogenesis protein CcsA [Spirochaetota bacterium]|nr:cytochrome c biogenesis protein CcsA [Spirochaetota bacterium]HSA14746.1 cytochrome c biogenesis protein CcsA [Spirochaetota bacterium]
MMPMFIVLNILMTATIVLAFLWAPSAEILGHSSRIIYFHVPVAWVSVLSFAVSGIMSIVYLRDRNTKYKLIEEKAHASASIGLAFTVLTIISGSIWAKISWGSFWNWDPRERTIVVLLLIYIAYFILRAALGDSPEKRRISSAYLVFTMAVMPFFVFVIPRMYDTLHPDTIINTDRKIKLATEMRLVLLLGALSFTALYINLYRISVRIISLRKTIEEDDDE